MNALAAMRIAVYPRVAKAPAAEELSRNLVQALQNERDTRKAALIALELVKHRVEHFGLEVRDDAMLDLARAAGRAWTSSLE
jgi:hypothetical protein